VSELQPTVFLVDDDASVRRGLERLVRAAGYAVEAFASADEFLARLPVQGVGCAILDVQMPGISGPQLHERLVQLGVGVPVLFLTAHGDVPTSVSAIKRGALDFLMKPVDGDVLLAAVGQAMARHASEMESNRARCGIEARLARLSPRERQVMEGVIAGRLNKQIAADLVISEKTVKVHRSRVMEKMEAGSLAELVHLCESLGITTVHAAETKPARFPG
jgi:FixJ family two-component response regulator